MHTTRPCRNAAHALRRHSWSRRVSHRSGSRLLGVAKVSRSRQTMRRLAARRTVVSRSRFTLARRCASRPGGKAARGPRSERDHSAAPESKGPDLKGSGPFPFPVILYFPAVSSPWTARMKIVRCLAFLSMIASGPAAAQQSRIEQQYAEAADRIIRAATADDRAYKRLGDLVDTFGHRLSGSK